MPSPSSTEPLVAVLPLEKPRPLWRHPLVWVPSLYLAMGIPFNVVMGGTAARMYKSLGYTDGQITVALGSIGMAWSLKPLWAAFLDMYRTKKFFVLAMELLIGALLAGIAMSLPLPGFFQISIALLWIAAFASSTQDICADGIYLTALDRKSQARLAGLQSTFWVLGKVLATGVLISVLDRVRVARAWPEQQMWQMVMLVSAAAMIALAAYHFFQLPTGSTAQRPKNARQVATDFVGTAVSFFHKRMFWGMIAFVFLFRLGEGLILIEGQLFLQTPVAQGGLGLSAGQVSEIDAIWGTISTIVGGLLGGMFVSRLGLWRCLGILGLCLNVPHFTYVYLSQAAAAGHGVDHLTIVTMVSIEKFGYGFGFVGNMIYMMQQLAPGRCTMTHYAFATALMNLVLVPTNMISGPLAEWVGFSTFFVVVMFASVPSAWAAFKAPFPHRGDEATGDAGHLTADDPTRLDTAQRTVQALAGRASLYAMLIILTLLIVDARILGSLQGQAAGTGRTQFALLLGSAALKAFFAWRAFRFAREAESTAARSGEIVYVRNARGAKIATLVCGVISAAVLAFGAGMAF
jgi:MFS transporter, PAT family, beta-lactamase induction signal transducer AmpG